MTFANFAKAFPHYWTSYWSAADNVKSSLIPEEGLPDQTSNYADQAIYCAHPHMHGYCIVIIISMNFDLRNHYVPNVISYTTLILTFEVIITHGSLNEFTVRNSSGVQIKEF